MLDITPFKVLIVLLVALIVLGPERLPAMARQASRAWRDFRRFRDHLDSEVRGAVLGEPTRQSGAGNAGTTPPPPEGRSVTPTSRPRDQGEDPVGRQPRTPDPDLPSLN